MRQAGFEQQKQKILSNLVEAQLGINTSSISDSELDELWSNSLLTFANNEEGKLVDLVNNNAKNSDLLDFLANKVTVNESYFFRHQFQFSFLIHHIIPQVIENNKSKKSLSICSIGCSAGQEIYSVAILLDQHFNLDDWDINLNGCDISSDMINKAKSGIYLDWDLRSIDPLIKYNYFDQLSDQWVLKPHIRDRVTFNVTNLNKPFNVPANFNNHIDIVFCRNMLMYLKPDNRKILLSRITDFMDNDSYLIISPTDFCADLSTLLTRLEPIEAAHFSLRTECANIKNGINAATPTTTARPDQAPQAVQKKPSPLSTSKPPIENISDTAPFETLALMDKGDLAQAEVIITRHLKRNPLDEKFHYLNYIFHSLSDNLAPAEKCLKKLLFLNPNCIDGNISFAYLIAPREKPRSLKHLKLALNEILDKQKKDEPQVLNSFILKGLSYEDALSKLNNMMNELNEENPYQTHDHLS